MERAVYTIVGILTLVLLAWGLTEATFAVGRVREANDQAPTPAPTPTVVLTPTPSASPTPTPTPEPTVTPVPTPVARTAVTNSFVRLRAGASTSSAVLAELNGGTVVTLGSFSNSQWQEVYVNGLHGYIFKTYLQY